MLKKYLTLFFIFFILNISKAQQRIQLSAYAEVSVLTYGPGYALYEKFGHTAIRIKDPVLQLDLIYNYGFFDLTESNFYVNFTKGYMKYKLVRYYFPPSLKHYNDDNRWAKEQILNLTNEQKNSFFSYLENNALPKNASYFYDPFYNNCSTKPADIIKNVLGKNVIFKDSFVVKNLSIRELMNNEIHTNTWGSIGINIALGSKLDKIATSKEYLYLPDYVFKSLACSKVIKNGKEENLIVTTKNLLDYPEKELQSDTVSPFIIFFILLLVGLLITYKDFKNNSRSKWLDFLILFTTGLFGILIVFLWFFTNHSTAPNNFNILWGFAPNIIVSFLINKKKPPRWISKYLIFLLVLLVLIPIIWILRIQLFPKELICFIILVGIRYLYLLKFTKNFE